MATTTTVPDFLAAFVPLLRTALPGVQVSDAWPGPDATADETVFIGDEIENWDVEIAGIKAGRKHRQESYEITVEAWVGKAGELREDAATLARSRAIALINAIDNMLADDPETIPAVQHVLLIGRGAQLVPFDKGWACQATATVEVSARLT